MSHVTRTGAHMISPQTAFIIDTDLHDTQVCVCCSVVQCGAVWCSVVQCGAVWCSVVQCGAVWCNVVQCVAVRLLSSTKTDMIRRYVCTCVLHCVAVCCSVLQCVFLIDIDWHDVHELIIHSRACVCCRVMECVAVWCSVYVPVVVCCSVLWCDGVCSLSPTLYA